MARITIIILSLLLIACQSSEFDREQVRVEIEEMLSEYHAAIAKDGLLAEFTYLDDSDDFFWVPPGYSSVLDYDSVRSILTQNAPLLSYAKFTWETLEIYPLSAELGTYSGVLVSVTEDTAGTRTTAKMIESGTLIKRKDGWKLLSGQSRVLDNQ